MHRTSIKRASTNTDRRVQIGRQAIEPPGDARHDIWIIEEMARGLGLDWNYSGVDAVFDEMRAAMPSIGGITWDRLQREHSVTYPCTREGDPGQPILFEQDFPTPNGRGKFVPAEYTHAAELPDDEYPKIFMTGRQLEHWHTGSMTRNARVLDLLEPEPVINVHPTDMDEIGVEAGEFVRVESRRGAVVARVRTDPGIQPGSLFMAFCYVEAAANLLTTEELDPVGKIPEFKYCAVRLGKAIDNSAPRSHIPRFNSAQGDGRERDGHR